MQPSQKSTRSRTRQRRAHHAKAIPNVAECPRCNNPKLPHAACDNCGFVRPGLSLKIEKEE
jgi:large subunit ribosomal protein L32